MNRRNFVRSAGAALVVLPHALRGGEAGAPDHRLRIVLLHCHQQLHMDYGFMQILKYVD